MKADRRIAGWAVRTAALGAMPRTACPPIRLSAQSRFWRPEDRALISDFSYVTAVAASPFTVFGATTHGLVVYDRQARTWRLPVTTLDGYPASRVRAALADATGNAVWLGTTSGWARYDADAQRWDSGFVAGGVSNLVLDARDAASGVYVQGAFGWSFLPRGAIVPVADRPLPPPGQRIQPLDAGTALNLAPAAQALRALILTDPRLRAHRFLSAARSPDRSDLFFGTDGMGLVRVDAATAEWENLSYGLLSARAGAVARAPRGAEGCWVGTMRGLAVVTNGDKVIPVGNVSQPVLSLVTVRESLWVGTAGGLRLLAPGSSDVAVTPDVAGQPALRAPILALTLTGDTLGARPPAQFAGRDPATRAWTLVHARAELGQVTALAPDEGGVWVGGANGLAFWDLARASFRVLHVPDDLPAAVRDVAVERRWLWVATDSGLVRFARAEARGQ